MAPTLQNHPPQQSMLASLRTLYNRHMHVLKPTIWLQKSNKKNTKTYSHEYEAGDLVWLHLPHTPQGQSRKLRNPWNGPHRVLARLHDCTYSIISLQDNKEQVVHFNRLKPYRPDTRHSRPIQPAAEDPPPTMQVGT